MQSLSIGKFSVLGSQKIDSLSVCKLKVLGGQRNDSLNLKVEVFQFNKNIIYGIFELELDRFSFSGLCFESYFKIEFVE